MSGWDSPSLTCSLLKSSISYVWAGFVSQSVTLIRPFSLSGGVIQTLTPKHLCFKSLPHLWNLKRLLCRVLGHSGPIHCLTRSSCVRYVMQSYVWWSYMPKGWLYVGVGVLWEGSDNNKRTPVPSFVQVLTRGAAGLNVTVLSLCLNLAKYLDNLLGRVNMWALNTNLLRVREVTTNLGLLLYIWIPNERSVCFNWYNHVRVSQILTF